jgi:hypothetical protein
MRVRNISGKRPTPTSADAFMKAIVDAGHQERVAAANDNKNKK